MFKAEGFRKNELSGKEAIMRSTLRRALYITLGLVILSITIQEKVHARTMKRITPEQIQKLDRAMAIETFNGEFLDITKVAKIRKTFGNLEGLKDGAQIKLANGDVLTARDIRFLYVERLKQQKEKKSIVGRTPHDEE